MPREVPDEMNDYTFGAEETFDRAASYVHQRYPKAKVSVNTKRRFRVALKLPDGIIPNLSSQKQPNVTWDVKITPAVREFEGPYRFHVSEHGALFIYDMDKIHPSDIVIVFAHGQWVSIEPLPPTPESKS